MNNHPLITGFLISSSLWGGLFFQGRSYADPSSLAEPPLQSPAPLANTCQNLNLDRFIVTGATAILVRPLHAVTFKPHGEGTSYPIVLSPLSPIWLSPDCQADNTNSYIQANLVASDDGFYIHMQSMSLAGYYIELPARSDWVPFERIPDPQERADSGSLCNLLNPSQLNLNTGYDSSGLESIGMQITTAALSTVCNVAVGRSAYFEQAVISPEMIFSLRLGNHGEGSLQTACVPTALRSVSIPANHSCLPNGTALVAGSATVK